MVGLCADLFSKMANEPDSSTASDWRHGLPTLAARLVTLREPVATDLGAAGRSASLC